MKQMEQNINEQLTRILDRTQKLIIIQDHAEEMDRIANVDALTKVRNKRGYDEKITQLNEELKNGECKGFGMAMVDLNDLKKINDRYGHDKGDLAIQRLCGVICSMFKHSPVFRIGGDEFVVVLEGEDLENSQELIDGLAEKWKKNQDSSELKPWEKSDAAVGFAEYQEGDTAETVFKRADRAMYEQKNRMKHGKKNG